MQEMGAGASASSTHPDSTSPRSILSTPNARQRTVSATAQNSSTQSMGGQMVSSSQVNVGINQPSTSNTLLIHRMNELPYSEMANTPSTVSSSFVLDMPAGEIPGADRIPSERRDNLHATIMGNIINQNIEGNRREIGILEGASDEEARRITARLERIPIIGNRFQSRAGSLRQENINVDTNQSYSREREIRDDTNGNGSPMGFLSQLIHQNPELSGVVKATEKYIPFVLIAAAKGFFDHATGIFVFIALMITFYHANSVITREVSRHARRNIWPLIAVLVNLLACIVFIHFVFEDAKLYLLTIFLPSGKIESFSELFWIVGVNDFILKFVAVIFKIVIVMLPGNFLPYRKRGNCFLFIEMSSQMHRSLVPIQVWLTYLLEGGLPGANSEKRIPSKVIGVILTAMYMVIKGKLIMKDAMAWKIAASRFWQNIQYGMNPTIEDLKTCGGICPICHDNLKDATMLHCKHIFCEECVATWFDRERTCPMCRAQVSKSLSIFHQLQFLIYFYYFLSIDKLEPPISQFFR